MFYAQETKARAGQVVGLSASNKGDEGRREPLGVDVREQVSRWIADDEDGLVVGIFGTMCFLLCDFFA